MENTKNEAGKQLEIDYIKLQDENQRLGQEVSLLKSEIHKLSETHKALLSETQARRSPDSMDNSVEQYQKTISLHEQNESRMKKSISDLEYSLKLKENENSLLHQRRIKETSLAKTKLFSAIKKISTKLFSSMNQMYALISQQFPLLESLKEKLGYKFIQFSEELYSANTVIEKLTEENAGYRLQIADLELRLQHPSSGINSDLKAENVRLHSEIEALESKLKESPSTTEYSKLQTDYSTLEKKYNAKVSTLNSEIAGLKANVESAQQDVLVVEHSRKNTARRNREQSDQMKTLKRDCETVSQNIVLQCNKKIEEFKRKIFNLEDRLKLLHELLRRIIQKNKILESSTVLASKNSEFLVSEYQQNIEKINKKYKDMFSKTCSSMINQEDFLQSQLSTKLLKLSDRILSIPIVQLQSTLKLMRKEKDENKSELKVAKEIISKSGEASKKIIGFILGQNMMDETEDEDYSLELSLVIPTLKSKMLIIMKKIIQMQLEKRTAMEERIKKIINAIAKLISFSRRPLQRVKSRYAEFFRKMKNQEKLLSTKTEEIKDLNLKLEELSDKNTELTKKAETDIINMRKSIEEKNKELIQLKENQSIALKKLAEQIEKLKTEQVDKIEPAVIAKIKSSSDKIQTLKNRMGTFSILITRIQQYETTLLAQTNEIAALKQSHSGSVQELQEQFLALNTKIQELEVQQAADKLSLKQRNDNILALNNKLKLSQEKLNSISTVVKRGLEHLRFMQSTVLSTLKSQRNIVQKEFLGLTQNIEIKISALQNKVEFLENSNAATEEKQSELLEKSQKKLSELQSQNHKFMEQLLQNQQQIHTYEETIAEKENQIKILHNTISENEKKQIEKNNILQKQLKDTQEGLEKSQTEIEETKKLNQQNQDTIQSLKKKIGELQQNEITCSEKIGELQTSNKTLAEQALIQKQIYQNQEASSKQIIEDLQKKITENEVKLSEIEKAHLNTVMEIQKKNSDLEHQKEILEEQTEIQSQRNQTNKEAVELLKKDIETLEDDNKTLFAQTQKEKEELLEKQAQLQKQISEEQNLKKEIEEKLQQQNSTLEEQVASLQSNMDLIKNSNSETEGQFITQISELQKRINEISSEKKLLNEKVLEKEKIQNQNETTISDLKKQIESIQEENKKIITETEETVSYIKKQFEVVLIENKELHEQISNATLQYQEASNNSANLDEQLKKLIKEKNTTEAQLEEKAKQFEEQEAEMTNQKEKFAEQKKHQEKILLELNIQLEQMKELNNNDKEKINIYLHTIEEMQKKYDQLGEQKLALQEKNHSYEDTISDMQHQLDILKNANTQTTEKQTEILKKSFSDLQQQNNKLSEVHPVSLFFELG